MRPRWLQRTRHVADQAADPTIKGHPSAEFVNHAGEAVMITLCANCGAMRSVLFLDNDRWFCTTCRNEGSTRPATVSLHIPGQE